jgi:hypothetical protein
MTDPSSKIEVDAFYLAVGLRALQTAEDLPATRAPAFTNLAANRAHAVSFEITGLSYCRVEFRAWLVVILFQHFL